MSDNPLTGLVLVIVLGIAAQWIAWRIKLPSILLLLSFGILAGPVLGWLKPDALLGDVLLPIVTIAVGLILFEGGLSLKFSELQQISRPLLGILTVGAAVTWGGTAVLAHTILGFSWSMSILAGAILIVSGPTVVGPILLQVRPNKKVASIARWEGIVIDPIGVILAVIVFEVIRAILTHEPLSGAAWALAKAIGVGIGLGMAGAALLVQLLRRYWVPDHLQNAFVVAFVTAVLFGANAIQHEAGILAVTLMGIFVANQKAVSVRHIVEFKENLRVLLIAGIFILLAARLESDALTVFGGKAPLFLAALILVVRPLAVFLSTWGSDLKRNEKLFLSWLAPRGIVAAAMGSVLAIQLERAEHPEARLLVPIIFWVIIGTVFVYGLTVDREIGRA
ncbi:MAG: sodium:proton antiporter, partial [Planctomycetota bacterium]